MLELGEVIVNCAEISVFLAILWLTSALISKSSQLLPL